MILDMVRFREVVALSANIIVSTNNEDPLVSSRRASKNSTQLVTHYPSPRVPRDTRGSNKQIIVVPAPTSTEQETSAPLIQPEAEPQQKKPDTDRFYRAMEVLFLRKLQTRKNSAFIRNQTKIFSFGKTAKLIGDLKTAAHNQHTHSEQSSSEFPDDKEKPKEKSKERFDLNKLLDKSRVPLVKAIQREQNRTHNLVRKVVRERPIARQNRCEANTTTGSTSREVSKPLESSGLIRTTRLPSKEEEKIVSIVLVYRALCNQKVAYW
jgi:hypothetical protein